MLQSLFCLTGFKMHVFQSINDRWLSIFNRLPISLSILNYTFINSVLQNSFLIV
ncbi:hypothetical protein ACJX0J_008190, partial [Zea mays]